MPSGSPCSGATIFNLMTNIEIRNYDCPINHNQYSHGHHSHHNQPERLGLGHVLSPLLYHGVYTFLCRTSNSYFASCPFNTCMLANFAGSLNSLPLDLNNAITANSFYFPQKHIHLLEQFCYYEKNTHLPIFKYPHHKCHKEFMTQDVYIYFQ